MLGVNLILHHSPGQSFHRSLDCSPANKGCGNALLSGLIPLFYNTFTLSSGVKMSWIAEGLIQYAMYRTGTGRTALLIQGASLHSLWVGFVSGLWHMKSPDHIDPPGQDFLSNSLPTTTCRSPSLLGFCHQVAECQPKIHPGSFIGTSIFASDHVLCPWAQQAYSEVVSPGKPRNQTPVLQWVYVLPSRLRICMFLN